MKKQRLKKERIEISTFGQVFRFYFTHPDNFNAIMLMSIDGDEGTIQFLKGDPGLDFFKSIRKSYKKIFPKGVDFVRFGMMAPTLRALRSATKDVYNFRIERTYVMKRRKFYRVEITLKEQR